MDKYYKTPQMIQLEEHAKSLGYKFHELRKVSMAACIVQGHLVVGNRHFCPIMRLQLDRLGIKDYRGCHGDNQGFIDQWGIYMTREEAWVVAERAGQIVNRYSDGILFSECYL